jgi:hypothetical protein
MKSTLFLLATIVLHVPIFAQPHVKGIYGSPKAESLGNGTYGTRTITLAGNTWDLHFTLHLDSALTMPVFTFHAKGTYKLEGPSATVVGAQNAVFYFDKKYVTLHTANADITKNFGFAACNLQVGKEQDITDSGCSFLVSKAACGQEYDLLKADGNQLFLGIRPAQGDMCAAERRPTALSYPLARK